MLFTFPSRYWFAIGLMGVFSLTGWARQIHTGLHVSRATQDTTMSWHASNKGLSPAMAKLSRIFFSQFKYNNVVLQPQHCIIQHWFGLIPVRSPLLGESLVYFLFLEVLRCFSSPGSPHRLCGDTRVLRGWVVPFGNPRINGYLHLPAAYRSLSRPSSPP